MYDAYDRYLAYEDQESYTWLIDELSDDELLFMEALLWTLCYS